MELDTGSALAILPASMFHEHFDLPLQPTSIMLKPYAGDRLRPKGVFRAHVCYNGQEFEADAYVVDSDGPALNRTEQNIVFDWPSLHNIKANATSAPLLDGTRRRLDALRLRYAAVFGSNRGHLQPSRGHLTLRDGAQPKFLKARPLPYALRDRVGLELDRLNQDGILTKVSHSDWATPVVPIPKKDGLVRICGDFKVTVNPQLKVDQYPLPRIDDIFASLGGGKHFSISKIDLRSTYLQMEMDDESKTLLTLNFHKGLYRLSRLAFGIASAPAMWQRVMDQLLSGIPKTQCIIDDIIVTGKTDDEHIRNLEMVLQRLLDAGLRAQTAKTRFFDAKTENCGHVVSADGLHKLPPKVDTIRDTPQPTNVSQLRRFSWSGELLCSILAESVKNAAPAQPIAAAQHPLELDGCLHCCFRQSETSNRI